MPTTIARVTPNTRRHLLPVAGKLKASIILTDPDHLYPMLVMPGQPMAIRWYGPEVLIRFDRGVLVAECQLFRRYIYGLVDGASMVDGKPMLHQSEPRLFGTAALEVRKPDSTHKHPVLKRIFVMEQLRRCGMATALLEQAKADFANLRLDGALTREGAAFFGYKVPFPADSSPAK